MSAHVCRPPQASVGGRRRGGPAALHPPAAPRLPQEAAAPHEDDVPHQPERGHAAPAPGHRHADTGETPSTWSDPSGRSGTKSPHPRQISLSPSNLVAIVIVQWERREDACVYRLSPLPDDSHVLRLRSGQRRRVRPGRTAGHSTRLVPHGPPAEHPVSAGVPAQRHQRPPAVPPISAGTRRNSFRFDFCK